MRKRKKKLSAHPVLSWDQEDGKDTSADSSGCVPCARHNVRQKCRWDGRNLPRNEAVPKPSKYVRVTCSRDGTRKNTNPFLLSPFDFHRDSKIQVLLLSQPFFFFLWLYWRRLRASLFILPQIPQYIVRGKKICVLRSKNKSGFSATFTLQ